MANLFHPERKNWTKAEKVNVRSFFISCLGFGSFATLKNITFSTLHFLLNLKGKCCRAHYENSRGIT